MFDELSRDVSTPARLVAYVVSEGVRGDLYGIDYAARVTEGVAHLDAELPGWWSTDHPNPIDLDALDVGHDTRCVSAQLSGDFSWFIGLSMLGLSDGPKGTYTLYGFNAEDYHPYPDCGADDADEYEVQEVYSLLTLLWASVIRVRRGEPVDLRP